MYLYELIGKCDEKKLTAEFLELCADSPDIRRTEEGFLSFLGEVKGICPVIADDTVIFIELVTELVTETDKPFDSVYAKCAGDPEKYGLMANPWAETLGFTADPASIESYGIEKYTALVMWEMTYLGFSEETVRKRVAEWDSAE